MSIYCTYVTFYRGNKLPPFYIGSSSVEKVNNGYHGSVSSKQYRDIWQSELKTNPHLFITKILTTHNDRKESLAKELKLQKLLNAVTNSMYINKSFAAVNGFFGMQVPKELHPSYGLEWSDERKLEHGEKRTKYFKTNKVIWIHKNESSKQTTLANYNELIKDGWSLGRKQPKAVVKTELTCPHCNATGSYKKFKYSHFDRCKYHPNNIIATLANEKLKYYEYYGNYYKTYEELELLTGCSTHLYIKYYKQGIDPRPHFNSRNYPIRNS